MKNVGEDGQEMVAEAEETSQSSQSRWLLGEHHVRVITCAEIDVKTAQK